MKPPASPLRFQIADLLYQGYTPLEVVHSLNTTHQNVNDCIRRHNLPRNKSLTPSLSILIRNSLLLYPLTAVAAIYRQAPCRIRHLAPLVSEPPSS